MKEEQSPTFIPMLYVDRNRPEESREAIDILTGYFGSQEKFRVRWVDGERVWISLPEFEIQYGTAVNGVHLIRYFVELERRMAKSRATA